MNPKKTQIRTSTKTNTIKKIKTNILATDITIRIRTPYDIPKQTCIWANNNLITLITLTGLLVI